MYLLLYIFCVCACKGVLAFSEHVAGFVQRVEVIKIKTWFKYQIKLQFVYFLTRVNIFSKVIKST